MEEGVLQTVVKTLTACDLHKTDVVVVVVALVSAASIAAAAAAVAHASFLPITNKASVDQLPSPAASL